MRKPSLAIVLPFALLLALLATACEKGHATAASPAATASPAPSAAATRLVVLSTFLPIHVIALNVAGGVPGVELQLMAPRASGCLHDYQMSPADAKKIQGAGLVLADGAGMETFLPQVRALNAKARIAELATGKETIVDSDGTPNPHLWVSVEGEAAMADAAAAALSEADPEDGAAFSANAAAYKAKLASLLAEMKATLAPYAGRKLFTFHEAFPYFAAEFGLEVTGVVELEPGTEPSSAQLAAYLRRIGDTETDLIAVEPQYGSGPAEVLSRESGRPLVELDPAVTTDASSPQALAASYLETQRANARALAAAFSAERK